MKKALVVASIALATYALPVAAQGVVELELSGNAATAAIELPGGIGADLEISFDSVVGLSAANLGLTAVAVDPANTALLARFPGLSLVSPPAAFPVLVTVEPPSTGGLSFSGIVSVELHTHNLAYTTNSPLRLFSAPVDGDFEDITSSAGSGSYRVRGSKGGFSEFLIVADLRSHDSVIQAKFERAQAVLDDNASAIFAEVREELWVHLDAATWSWYSQGDLLAAIEAMEAFLETVEEHEGCGIPNVWRSSRDLVNVAGELRSAGLTLIFSLRQKHSQGL